VSWSLLAKADVQDVDKRAATAGLGSGILGAEPVLIEILDCYCLDRETTGLSSSSALCLRDMSDLHDGKIQEAEAMSGYRPPDSNIAARQSQEAVLQFSITLPDWTLVSSQSRLAQPEGFKLRRKV